MGDRFKTTATPVNDPRCGKGTLGRVVEGDLERPGPRHRTYLNCTLEPTNGPPVSPSLAYRFGG